MEIDLVDVAFTVPYGATGTRFSDSGFYTVVGEPCEHDREVQSKA